MIDLTIYALYGISFGFILSAPVGPVNIICLRRALFGKALDGFLIGVGAAVGDVFYAGLAAFGLKAIFSIIEENSLILKLLGGIVMLVFAYKIWRSHPHLDKEPITGGVFKGALGALAVTLADPAIFLGFLGLYSLVGIREGQSFSTGTLALLSGVFAGALIWWVTLVLLTRRFRDKVNDSLLEKVNHVSAGIIGLFAISTLLSMFVSGKNGFF